LLHLLLHYATIIGEICNNNMAKISTRQSAILEIVREKGKIGNKEIRAHLPIAYSGISRFTILRDLEKLAEMGMVEKVGGGRGSTYQIIGQQDLLRFIDPKHYFSQGPDERAVAFPSFNFSVWADWQNIFTVQELKDLQKLNAEYQNRVKKLSPTSLQKEFERLTIELSWKSASIEGNTYSLIDTEILIKENKEAVGHEREEAIMILNHKKTLDYILASQREFAQLNVRKIENIQRLLVTNLGISHGLRQRVVGIVGTSYRPLDNQYQIREALEKTCALINKIEDPFSKALLAILLISYIQPFEDGNKRTGRLLGNAILLAHNACPLSFRSVDEAEYKKAMILFYEQNSARYFKELFVEQFKFAVANYFLA